MEFLGRECKVEVLGRYRKMETLGRYRKKVVVLGRYRVVVLGRYREMEVLVRQPKQKCAWMESCGERFILIGVRTMM